MLPQYQLQRVRFYIGVLTAMFLATSAQAQTTLWVDDDAPNDPNPYDPTAGDPDEDGSPNHPFDEIQEAINATTAPRDVVMVRDGIYRPPAIEGYTFPEIGDQVLREIELRSEQGPANCIIDGRCLGSFCRDEGRGFVFDAASIGRIGRNAVVDGFTIRGGFMHSGGGVWLSHTDPKIRNCIITENGAKEGAGIYAQDGAHPLIENCEVTGNTALWRGGGMYFRDNGDQVRGEIRNCVVASNEALANEAGGMLLKGSVATRVLYSRFEGNNALQDGGGLVASGEKANVQIAGCTFVANTATGAASRGGGLALLGSNQAGAFRLEPYVLNVVVLGNTAVAGGGGIFVSGYSKPELSNATYYNNVAATSGQGNAIYYDHRGTNPPATIVGNSIVWSDWSGHPNPPPSMDNFRAVTSGLQVKWSDVSGALPANVVGEDNYAVEPQFVDAVGEDDVRGTGDEDLHLEVDSPLIDAGSNFLVPLDQMDLDGDTKFDERTPYDADASLRFADDSGPSYSTGEADPPDYPRIVDIGGYEHCWATADCTDNNWCTGSEFCQEFSCHHNLPRDCQPNGIDDLCDINGDPITEDPPSSYDCNATGIPDECEEGQSFPAKLIASYYLCEASLPRIQNHVIRLTFACAVQPPSPGAGHIFVQELQELGNFGPDLSASFSFDLESDGRVLRITENGQVLQNGKWYAIHNTGSWSGVDTFEVDYVTVRGDADNTLLNDFADQSFIFANLNGSPSDQDRSNINGDESVDFADISDAFGYNGSFAPPKPTGHTCTVP